MGDGVSIMETVGFKVIQFISELGEFSVLELESVVLPTDFTAPTRLPESELLTILQVPAHNFHKL